MEQIDYIVVGLGIAGLTICERLEENKCSYVVFDSAKNGSTLVSGGVVNPVVLKRFTAVWNVNTFLSEAIQFYNKLSDKLNIPVWQEEPVYRILNSIEEQNDWMVTSDKRDLSAYMSSEISQNKNDCIKAPFGFGKVKGSGKIDPNIVFKAYREFLNNKLIDTFFDYSEVSENESSVIYKNYSAKKIIFTEGAAVLNNPFFKKEYIVPNKGEYIIVKSLDLKLKEMVKGPMFILPLGEDLYKVGASYSREAENFKITDSAKDEIVMKLKKMISCDFEIVDQITGIRPTTKDRKPLLGSLPESDKKIFFNGLGTRGILMAPYLSKILFDFFEIGKSIPKELDIRRVV